MHRNLGVFTGRAASSLPRLFRQLFGKDGRLHAGPRPHVPLRACSSTRIVGMISHLGAMLPVADGLALAAQLRGEKRVAAGLHRRRRHERGRLPRGAEPGRGLEAAGAVRDREQPVAASRPRSSEQYACRHLADRGVGYGMPGVRRGRQRPARRCSRAVRRAAGARPPRRRRPDAARVQDLPDARATRRPRAPTYVPQQIFEEWAKKDPVDALRELCSGEQGVLGGATSRRGARGAARPRSTRSVDDGARGARARLDRREQSSRDVYAPSPAPRPPLPRAKPVASRAGAPLRRRDQRRPARGDAARRPRRADGPGHRRVRRRLQGHARASSQEFGKARVRNTPIIESGARRRARSASPSTASCPMVEMQFGDFITCGFNQIVNNLAKTHYRWGAARAGA